MTDRKVSFAETIAIEVGRFLRTEYPTIDLANNNGMFISMLKNDYAIGFLAAGSAPKLNWWQKLFHRPRRRFMGVLWFSNEPRKATRNRWLIEVYGDQDIEFLTEVAERLSEKFEASVHLKLVDENPHYETLWSD